jgi:hypothetical protein
MALSFGGISDGSRSSWLDDDDGGDDLKFGYSEKAKKSEKKFHLKFDAEYSVTSKFKWKIFFQILWPSQNIRTLRGHSRV